MNFWTDGEINYLRENYSTNPNVKEICRKLNRSLKSIRHKAARIGISRLRFPSDKPINRQPRTIIDKMHYERNKEKILNKKRNSRKALKIEIKKILGGKCSRCGYDKCLSALDFHHNQGNKEETVSILLRNCSKQKILKEIKKCILLCANCHREVHAGL